jgi:hypothetical protein
VTAVTAVAVLVPAYDTISRQVQAIASGSDHGGIRSVVR